MTMACSDKAQVPDLPWGGVEQGGDRRRGGAGGGEAGGFVLQGWRGRGLGRAAWGCGHQ